MSDISKNIKRLRQENDLTQDELAEKLHVTRQAVSNWENDKNHPDIELLMQMAELFDVDVKEIYQTGQRGGKWRWLLLWVEMTALFTLWAVLWSFGRIAYELRSTAYVVYYWGMYQGLFLGLAFLFSGWVVAIGICQWRDLYVRDKKVRLSLLGLALIPLLLLFVPGTAFFAFGAAGRWVSSWWKYIFLNPWVCLFSGFIFGCLFPKRKWRIEGERDQKRWLSTLLLLSGIGALAVEWFGTGVKPILGSSPAFQISTEERMMDWLKAAAFFNFGGSAAVFLWFWRDLFPKSKRGRICLAGASIGSLLLFGGLIVFEHAIRQGAFLSYPTVKAFGRWLVKWDGAFLFVIPGFLLLCSLLPKREQRVDFPENIQ